MLKGNGGKRMEIRLDELDQLKDGKLIRQKINEITALIEGTGAMVSMFPYGNSIEYVDGKAIFEMSVKI
jgi:hypothetical protein